MTNNITHLEILQDKKIDGRNRPWKDKKGKSLQLADTYLRIGYLRYSERVFACGSFLDFVETADERLKLVNAGFCKVRLCPMCVWRKSLKAFANVSKILNRVQIDFPDLRPIFLTLTVKNCNSIDLRDTIKNLTESWYRLYKHRLFGEQIQGWIRSLEVTYNSKSDTYHPHIHAILMVDKSYFGKKNQKYISHKDWIHLWRISARLDYDPNIDIRRIRNTQKNIPRTIAEIVKYTVKDTDYIVNDVVTKTLTDALHRVRLIAYGGVIADTRKALNILDEEKSDLINISDTVRDDVATAIIRYGWSFSVGDYIRQKSS